MTKPVGPLSGSSPAAMGSKAAPEKPPRLPRSDSQDSISSSHPHVEPSCLEYALQCGMQLLSYLGRLALSLWDLLADACSSESVVVKELPPSRPTCVAWKDIDAECTQLATGLSILEQMTTPCKVYFLIQSPEEVVCSDGSRCEFKFDVVCSAHMPISSWKSEISRCIGAQGDDFVRYNFRPYGTPLSEVNIVLIASRQMENGEWDINFSTRRRTPTERSSSDETIKGCSLEGVKILFETTPGLTPDMREKALHKRAP
ncbi:MAG: hypothetical protein HYX48_01120 [Chlamydiales bacterium]|nr:hypothetical protein [Chlamydiales bacterium]